MWASGVLLFVMLLGMFPFEFEDPNYVNTAGLYGMWAEQMKSSWRDHPANAQVPMRVIITVMSSRWPSGLICNSMWAEQISPAGGTTTPTRRRATLQYGLLWCCSSLDS